MTIGNRIRKRREECGMSVVELAEKLGKARSTVYRYESDDIQDMPITVLEPLAEALDTTPAYLMGWHDDKNSVFKSVHFENVYTETPNSENTMTVYFDKFEFALYGEIRELDEEDKEELLRDAKRMRELRELRRQQKEK